MILLRADNQIELPRPGLWVKIIEQVIEDSCTVPRIMEINGHPLPLRDTKAIWMFVILGKPLCLS